MALEIKTSGYVYLSRKKGVRLDFAPELKDVKIVYEQDGHREKRLSEYKIDKLGNQGRKFLLLLLSYPGQALRNGELCSGVGTTIANGSGEEWDDFCDQMTSRVRNLLKVIFQENGEEKVEEWLPQIKGSTVTGGYGVRYGVHTIKLPEEATAAKTWLEEYPEAIDLAKNYWRQYSIVRPYKNVGRGGYQDNIPFHEVYRIPRLQADASEMDKIWRMSEFAGNGNLVYVEAPNGYGKSTLLQGMLLSSLYGCQGLAAGGFMAESALKMYEELAAFHNLPEGALVLLLQAEDLDCTGGDGIECLYASNPLHKTCEYSQFEKIVSDFNAKRKLFVLIDGYDEAEPEKQEQVVEWIERVSDAESQRDTCGKAVFLIAGRPLYEGEGQNPILGSRLPVQRWHLAPLDPEDDAEGIEQLLTKYVGQLRNRKPDTVERTKERIRSNPYLCRLPVTPFILVKMVEDCSRSDRAPHEIIDRVIDQLMKRQKRFGLRQQELFSYKLLHEELAYKMLSCGEEGVDYDYFCRYERSCYDRVDAYFSKKWGTELKTITPEDIFTITGLLQEDAEGRVGFLCSYVLIREFAARKLTRLMEGETCEVLLAQLNEIPCEYRYELLTMSMVQLMKNDCYCYVGYFFHGLSPYEKEDALTVFENYMLDRYAQSNDISEKEAISKAVALLLSNAYGNIPLTNVNNSAGEEQDMKMRKALQQILQETPPTEEGENSL